MNTYTNDEIDAVVADLKAKVQVKRHDAVGSVDIRGKLFASTSDSITLITGELVVNIHVEQMAGITALVTESEFREIEVRVKPDARVVIETSVEPGLVKGMLTGEVFMEVMKPGMRTFGWCDTHWCCRGACWCGIGECGAAEANYVPGTKFRQAVSSLP